MIDRDILKEIGFSEEEIKRYYSFDFMYAGIDS